MQLRPHPVRGDLRGRRRDSLSVAAVVATQQWVMDCKVAFRNAPATLHGAHTVPGRSMGSCAQLLSRLPPTLSSLPFLFVAIDAFLLPDHSLLYRPFSSPPPSANLGPAPGHPSAPLWPPRANRPASPILLPVQFLHLARGAWERVWALGTGTPGCRGLHQQQPYMSLMWAPSDISSHAVRFSASPEDVCMPAYRLPVPLFPSYLSSAPTAPPGSPIPASPAATTMPRYLLWFHHYRGAPSIHPSIQLAPTCPPPHLSQYDCEVHKAMAGEEETAEAAQAQSPEASLHLSLVKHEPSSGWTTA